MEPERGGRRYLIDVPGGEEEEAPVVREARREPLPPIEIPEVDEEEPLGGLEWGDIAKIELEQQLDVRTKYREYEYYENLGAIALESTTGEANNGESEWIVFENEDAAERAAIEHVRDDLDSNPEIFTQSWLENFINEEGFESYVREDVENYAYDAIDEDDLIRLEYLEERFDDEGNETPNTERDISAARERYINDDVREKVRHGPFAFFREIYGEHEAATRAIEALGINIDEAAQDAIDTDGVAHFLDGYDGETVELPSGAVAYGTN